MAGEEKGTVPKVREGPKWGKATEEEFKVWTYSGKYRRIGMAADESKRQKGRIDGQGWVGARVHVSCMG